MLYRLEDALGTMTVVEGVIDAAGDSDRFFTIRVGRGAALPEGIELLELGSTLGLADEEARSGAGVGWERP